MNGFSVGQKLGLGFGTIVCLLLIQGYASIAALGKLSNTLGQSVKRTNESSSLVSGIRLNVAEMKNVSKMTQFAYAINVKLDQGAASECVGCHTLPTPGTVRGDFATITADVQSKLQALAETGLSAEEKQSLDRVGRSTAEWSTVFGEFVDKASARGFADAHSLTIDRMEPIFERILKETKEVEAISARSLLRAQTEAVSSTKQSIVLLLVIQVVIILPVVFLVWRYIRRISTCLRMLREAANCLAVGDTEGAVRQLTISGP